MKKLIPFIGGFLLFLIPFICLLGIWIDWFPFWRSILTDFLLIGFLVALDEDF